MPATMLDFIAIAEKVLREHTQLRGVALEEETESLAYAFAETANARIEENTL